MSWKLTFNFRFLNLVLINLDFILECCHAICHMSTTLRNYKSTSTFRNSCYLYFTMKSYIINSQLYQKKKKRKKMFSIEKTNHWFFIFLSYRHICNLLLVLKFSLKHLSQIQLYVTPVSFLSSPLINSFTFNIKVI